MSELEAELRTMFECCGDRSERRTLALQGLHAVSRWTGNRENGDYVYDFFYKDGEFTYGPQSGADGFGPWYVAKTLRT